MGDEGQKAASPVAAGTFICVIGPSGAGKDTLIRLARLELGARPGFLFPPRFVTREKSAFEDHEILSPAQFDAGLREGRFALHWQAHGLSYAIESSILPALAAGATAVCNVSREAVAAAREKFADVKVVAITAPEAVLAARLAARGRESPEAVSERLARNQSFAAGRHIEPAPDITILNSGRPEAAAKALADFLIAIQARIHERKSADHPSR
jgi:ribose 1,5-bisphosphokinase